MTDTYAQIRILRSTHLRLTKQAAHKSSKRKKRVTILQHIDELSNPKRVPVRELKGI